MITINNLSNKKNLNTFIFSDLDFAFNEQQVSTNRRNSDVVAGNDVILSLDENAIRNSIRNILTQKRYLNPLFGATLYKFIGQPLSEMGAISIGKEIEKQINLYEPRIKLQNVLIAPDYDNFLYAIAIIITMPNFKNNQLILSSTFTSTGVFTLLDK